MRCEHGGVWNSALTVRDSAGAAAADSLKVLLVLVFEEVMGNLECSLHLLIRFCRKKMKSIVREMKKEVER